EVKLSFNALIATTTGINYRINIYITLKFLFTFSLLLNTLKIGHRRRSRRNDCCSRYLIMFGNSGVFCKMVNRVGMTAEDEFERDPFRYLQRLAYRSTNSLTVSP